MSRGPLATPLDPGTARTTARPASETGDAVVAAREVCGRARRSPGRRLRPTGNEKTETLSENFVHPIHEGDGSTPLGCGQPRAKLGGTGLSRLTLGRFIATLH